MNPLMIAELRAARLEADKLRVRIAKLEAAHAAQLEELGAEIAALRAFAAHLARSAGGGARL